MNSTDTSKVNFDFPIEDILNLTVVKDMFILFLAVALIYLLIKVLFQVSQNQLYSERYKQFVTNNSYIIQFLIWAFGLYLTFWLLIDYTVNNSILFNLFIILAFIFLAVNLLKNIYSGFLIYINKAFKIGDTIRFDKKTGIVKRIGIRSIHMMTDDQTEIIIPHSRILEETISVVSDKIESKQIDFIVEISDQDPNEVLHKIRFACYASPYIDYTKDVDVFIDKVDAHEHDSKFRIKAFVFDRKYASALKSDIIRNSTIYFNRNKWNENETN